MERISKKCKNKPHLSLTVNGKGFHRVEKGGLVVVGYYILCDPLRIKGLPSACGVGCGVWLGGRGRAGRWAEVREGVPGGNKRQASAWYRLTILPQKFPLKPPLQSNLQLPRRRAGLEEWLVG